MYREPNGFPIHISRTEKHPRIGAKRDTPRKRRLSFPPDEKTRRQHGCRTTYIEAIPDSGRSGKGETNKDETSEDEI